MNSTQVVEALNWLKSHHGSPCGDPVCDSVYCYIARRIVEGSLTLVNLRPSPEDNG